MNGQQSSQTANAQGGLCLDHENRIKRNTDDIDKLDDKTDTLDTKRESAVRRVHKRLDLMQWSIVGAMFAVVMEAAVLVFSILRGG